jgi:CHAT domain-containing protein
VEARDVYQLEAADGDSMWNLAESRALLGEAATRTNIINEAAAKDVIHLSTHGHFLRHHPLGSGVSLYAHKVEEVEELIRGNKQTSHVEYFLSAQDIIENVRLQAELLVVNGCLTGMSEAKPGDELMGLTRGLLYAGAKSLIVSLFPFYKKVSAGPYKQHGPTKFTEFYRRWQNQGMRKSEAFRAYVRAIKAEAEYSHPFNWFSLIYIGRI